MMALIRQLHAAVEVVTGAVSVQGRHDPPGAAADVAVAAAGCSLDVPPDGPELYQDLW